MQSLNLLLAKFLDMFKAKYPHQYFVSLFIVGAIAYFANHSSDLGMHLSQNIVDAINIICTAYGVVRSSDTKMLIATNGQHTNEKVDSGSYISQNGTVALPASRK